jgi:hypothetical protein
MRTPYREAHFLDKARPWLSHTRSRERRDRARRSDSDVRQSRTIPALLALLGLYPESANVYDSLGDAFVAKGDTTAAKAEFRRAVDVATRTGHPVLGESRRKLTELEQAELAGRARPRNP